MVSRNNGYGFQNTVSRVGAILGPQIAFLVSSPLFLIFYWCNSFVPRHNTMCFRGVDAHILFAYMISNINWAIFLHVPSSLVSMVRSYNKYKTILVTL